MSATSSSGSSNSAMSGVSDTSTLQWDHEAFETFQHRVKELCQNTIWPDYDSSTITVERMNGGGYNRIIGISVQPNDGEKIEYILRIPRDDDTHVKRDVDVLKFLAAHTSIPVPEVICFDGGSSNEIGSPYAVHKRIKGENLLTAYPKLTHQQRLVVAEQLGKAFFEMLNVNSTVPGLLGPAMSLPGATEQMFVSTLPSLRFVDKDYPVFYTPHVDGPALTSIEEGLIARFNFFKSRYLKLLKNNASSIEDQDHFIKMAAELGDLGLLKDTDYYSLAHPDFHPRNILVTLDAEGSGVQITILDWDGAVFRPALCTCQPPQWIWDWQEDEDEDERHANDTPKTKENQELKMCFELGAGIDYPRLAYGDVNRLTRRLVEFAHHGIFSSEHYREAQDMLAEWKAYYDCHQSPEALDKGASGRGTFDKLREAWYWLPTWGFWAFLFSKMGLGNRQHDNKSHNQRGQ